MELYQVYNALDCAITIEVHHELLKLSTPELETSYRRTASLQAPAMCMSLRGVRIDGNACLTEIEKLQAQEDHLQTILDRLAIAVWGKPLNPRSTTQLPEFFYEVMQLPKQYKFDKGVRKVSTDRTALENLSNYFHARPIINVILAMRDARKKLGVLRTPMDSDGRLRAAFNICGTETWRWSSSSNAFGTGTNLQNITGSLRSIFVSDPGWKLAYVDLEQAESRKVAYLSRDEQYITACESGDLHTTVCKLVWPTALPWTGDDGRDKALADGTKFYRDYSYRDLAKRGGHGTNYYGKAATIAKHLKITERVAQEFQDAYFEAFPGIRRWHLEVAKELQTTGQLTTPFGRCRHFFGRLRDDATLREAIAFVPQSSIGDVLNEGLRRVWERFDLGTRSVHDYVRQADGSWCMGESPRSGERDRIRMLAQIHDAFLFQYREEDERDIIPLVLDTMRVPVKVFDRWMVIPSEAQVGWNWDKQTVDKKTNAIINPGGIIKFTPSKWDGGRDPRVRPTEVRVLDRVICGRDRWKAEPYSFP